ncbi:MAG: TIGR02710 family CRISPR-associated CARF protein [Promethearchaeota archaeon]
MPENDFNNSAPTSLSNSELIGQIEAKINNLLNEVKLLKEEEKRDSKRGETKTKEEASSAEKDAKNKDLLLEDDLKDKIKKLEEEVWELSKQRFTILVKDKIDKKEIKAYKGIIFTIGFSKEPIILNILGFKPEFCYFIHTQQTEKQIDIILKETNLSPSQYQRKSLAKSDAAEIYNAVKEGLKFFRIEHNLKEDEIALDPTGGTKAMSVGCGLAINTYNLDMLYVDNKKYDPVLRRPRPGSETIVNIANPFKIFYDDVLIKGLDMLEEFNFEAAKKNFIKVETNAIQNNLAEVLKNITLALQFWDRFDHEQALSKFKLARELIDRYRIFSNIEEEDISTILDNWEAALTDLAGEGLGEKKIIDIFINANRKMHQKQEYDNASLRYYRCIEMWSQTKLKKEYQLDTKTPDYKHINYKDIEDAQAREEALLKDFNLVWKKIYERQGKQDEYKESNLLPRQIGLFNGLVLLHILGEKSITLDKLLKISKASEARNNSILAHGTKPIKKKDAEALEKITKDLIATILNKNNKFEKMIFNNDQIIKLSNAVKKIL